eukprot:1049368-Pleurochrysis_carterae.AAC.1
MHAVDACMPASRDLRMHSHIDSCLPAPDDSVLSASNVSEVAGGMLHAAAKYVSRRRFGNCADMRSELVRALLTSGGGGGGGGGGRSGSDDGGGGAGGAGGGG